MKQPPDIAVVVVSYQTVDLLPACLQSIEADISAHKEVFLVDNASTDGSAELVARDFPGVRLIANSENRGFGAANNQAFRLASARLLYCLNPDATIAPGTLAALVREMEAHPEIGLAGTAIVHPDGQKQPSTDTTYPNQRIAGFDSTGLPGDLACVLGASMVLRRDLLPALGGGFDEDFFLYGEDQDLGLRVRQAGFQVGYFPHITVTHLSAQSERSHSSYDRWKRKLTAEYIFYRKHYSPKGVARIRRRHLVKSLWALTTNLPGLWLGRESALERQAKYRAILDTAGHPPV